MDGKPQIHSYVTACELSDQIMYHIAVDCRMPSKKISWWFDVSLCNCCIYENSVETFYAPIYSNGHLKSFKIT